MTLSRWLPHGVTRTARRLQRRVLQPRLRIVYHEGYSASFAGAPSDALRAERILAALASEGLALRRCVWRPEPVWLKTLELVHDPAYLDALHDPATVGSALGIEIDRMLAERVLDLQRLMTGGTLMAMRRARRGGLGRGRRSVVGVNLGGGFHHAQADHGAGFCLLNDIAVAIADERRRGFKGRILVVDLDLHDGDGTRALFAADDSVHTFSIHARHWGPTDAVESTSLELGESVDDDFYLDTVRKELPRVIERFDPRLIVYLAGTDPAADDSLGSWRISPSGMLARDLFVVEQVRRARAQLCILLAGGYGSKTWRYTARFLSAIERGGEPIEPPSTAEITFKRYRWISSLFSAADLSGAGDDEFGITEADLYLPGWGAARERRFLGFYTRHAIELVLERAGFLDRLRDLGFSHPTLDFKLGDDGDTLRIYGHPNRSELLLELRVRRDRRVLAGLELLSIDWLLLQNPRAEFSARRPRLPGQEHPGLGTVGDVVAMLIMACGRLHLDGLVFVPSRYHIAVYGRRHMRFVDPETQALFEALYDLLRDLPLAEASRAVEEGRVVDQETGETVSWRPEPMGLAASEAMKTRLAEQDREITSPRLALRPAPASPSARNLS
ncbi:MAG: histone deacetylase [Acidobacteriota bacterium]